MVSDFQMYKLLSSEGVAEALRYFRQHPVDTPQVGHYRIAHNLTFDLIHPKWAGNVRKPGEEVSINGIAGTLSGSLPFDSDVHNAQCKEIQATSKNPLFLAAFTHARVLAMHPFIDGNGRSSRIVCDSMLRSIVGNKERLFAWDDDYKSSLRKTLSTNDLAPLMNNLSARAQGLYQFAPDGPQFSPFSLSAGFYTKRDVIKGVSVALESSRFDPGESMPPSLCTEGVSGTTRTRSKAA